MATTHSEVVELLESGSNPDLNVLLDDGEFSVHHNSNCELDSGNGFLHKICRPSWPLVGGYQVIGSYEKKLDGKWTSEISAPYDGVNDDSESKELGRFQTRNEAIAALWLARHEAFVKQA